MGQRQRGSAAPAGADAVLPGIRAEALRANQSNRPRPASAARFTPDVVRRLPGPAALPLGRCGSCCTAAGLSEPRCRDQSGVSLAALRIRRVQHPLPGSL